MYIYISLFIALNNNYLSIIINTLFSNNYPIDQWKSYDVNLVFKNQLELIFIINTYFLIDNMIDIIVEYWIIGNKYLYFIIIWI